MHVPPACILNSDSEKYCGYFILYLIFEINQICSKIWNVVVPKFVSSFSQRESILSRVVCKQQLFLFLYKVKRSLKLTLYFNIRTTFHFIATQLLIGLYNWINTFSFRSCNPCFLIFLFLMKSLFQNCHVNVCSKMLP